MHKECLYSFTTKEGKNKEVRCLCYLFIHFNINNK